MASRIGRRICQEDRLAEHRQAELIAQDRQQPLFRERAEADEDASQPTAIPLLKCERAGQIALADQTRLDQ